MSTIARYKVADIHLATLHGSQVTIFKMWERDSLLGGWRYVGEFSAPAPTPNNDALIVGALRLLEPDICEEYQEATT